MQHQPLGLVHDRRAHVAGAESQLGVKTCLQRLAGRESGGL
jgi:hypothetical protein